MQTSGQFVIQEHKIADTVHWDFMLETENTLQTWRIQVPPEKLLLQQVSTEQIFDHPLRFLTYQGPVNKGLGSVKIADKGTYETIDCTCDTIKLCLNGNILKGHFNFTHLDSKKWIFGFAYIR